MRAPAAATAHAGVLLALHKDRLDTAHEHARTALAASAAEVLYQGTAGRLTVGGLFAAVDDCIPASMPGVKAWWAVSLHSHLRKALTPKMLLDRIKVISRTPAVDKWRMRACLRAALQKHVEAGPPAA